MKNCGRLLNPRRELSGQAPGRIVARSEGANRILPVPGPTVEHWVPALNRTSWARTQDASSSVPAYKIFGARVTVRSGVLRRRERAPNSSELNVTARYK